MYAPCGFDCRGFALAITIYSGWYFWLYTPRLLDLVTQPDFTSMGGTIVGHTQLTEHIFSYEKVCKIYTYWAEKMSNLYIFCHENIRDWPKVEK